MAEAWSGETLWRHLACRDVAFFVLRRFYVAEKHSWSLRVEWWNIGVCHAPWPLGLTSDITLAESVFSDWVPFALTERLGPQPHKHLVL